MSENSTEPPTPTPTPAPGANLPEYSVSEISGALKKTVEAAFGRVRVRGEISGVKFHSSGHIYMTLKDENANLAAVCWRGQAGRLSIRPEDGMEVIAQGRVTTYPGQSKYQIVIEAMELAGEGALLKLLEERRKKLAAEGLFDEDRKKSLPFLPGVIGVVTSPTGAVIRDILHRLGDRFPRHVIIYGVPVQGDGADVKIADAIAAFNALPAGPAIPGKAARPDLIIVARGGGSLEDLMPFNEECVVRAVAACDIPLISAVGHETDVTLIDFVADKRAPTPTAAAEMAVPVRADLLAGVMDTARRIWTSLNRSLEERRLRLNALSKGLPEPGRILEQMAQRLDEKSERLDLAVLARLERSRATLAQSSAALRGRTLRDDISRRSVALGSLGGRLDGAVAHMMERSLEALSSLERVLESCSYRNVLKRGYAVVHGPDGVLMAAHEATGGMNVSLEFTDGSVAAQIGKGQGTDGSPPKKPAPKKPAFGKSAKGKDSRQGNLL